MRINADFENPAVVAPHDYQWVCSPQSGVERVMLDRIGGEKARATSIVRYAPDAWFPRHVHPDGEEILVLSGTFSDEGGNYPAGWYLRNPPGSSHRPFTNEGAIIFVKLGQMAPGDTRRVRVDTGNQVSWHRRNGREFCPLVENDAEQICLQRVPPGETVFSDIVDSGELLVLAGDVVIHGQSHPRGTWMRLPAGKHASITTGARGAKLYLKTGKPFGIKAAA
ncbi:cupin domain-containing protein [Lysobacter sp. CCNWLW3]|uniref:cupin domain-containing protein n=1 Tax=unclassified Lysobacter TaxID=2635362 RepID=UPI002FCFB595